MVIVFGILIFRCLISFAQGADSVTFEVNNLESHELLDYYRFEGIEAFLKESKKVTDARLLNKITTKEIKMRSAVPKKPNFEENN